MSSPLTLHEAHHAPAHTMLESIKWSQLNAGTLPGALHVQQRVRKGLLDFRLDIEDLNSKIKLMLTDQVVQSLQKALWCRSETSTVR